MDNPELLMILMQEEIRNSEVYRAVHYKYTRKFIFAAARFLREMQKIKVVRQDINLALLPEIFEAALFFPILIRSSHSIFSKELGINEDFIEKYSDVIVKILTV